MRATLTAVSSSMDVTNVRAPAGVKPPRGGRRFRTGLLSALSSLKVRILADHSGKQAIDLRFGCGSKAGRDPFGPLANRQAGDDVAGQPGDRVESGFADELH